MKMRSALFVTACIVAGCSSHIPVALPPSPTPDSIGFGRVYVRRIDGTTTILDKAYIRSDTIHGKMRREAGFGTRVVDAAVPLTEVRAVEQQRADATKTVLIVAGVGLFILLLLSSLSAAVPVY